MKIALVDPETNEVIDSFDQNDVPLLRVLTRFPAELTLLVEEISRLLENNEHSLELITISD